MKITLLELKEAAKWWNTLCGAEKVSMMKSALPWLYDNLYGEVDNTIITRSDLIVSLYQSFN